MGMYCEVAAALPQDLERFADPSNVFGGVLQRSAVATSAVSLEKAWHGLHYLLTGEAWEGDGPLAFLLSGGEQLGDDEESPVRWFTPDETILIHQSLSAVTDHELWSRFNPEEMEEQGIYPGIWDEAEEDLQEEYLTYFHELKEVVESATRSGGGLVITIG